MTGELTVDIAQEPLNGCPLEIITNRIEEMNARRIYADHREIPEKCDKIVGSVTKTIVEKATVPIPTVR